MDMNFTGGKSGKTLFRHRLLVKRQITKKIMLGGPLLCCVWPTGMAADATSPSLDGKNLLADPQTLRPFTGRLLNVSTHGKKFTINAGRSGVDCVRNWCIPRKMIKAQPLFRSEFVNNDAGFLVAWARARPVYCARGGCLGRPSSN